jgi:hypothetical protein
MGRSVVVGNDDRGDYEDGDDCNITVSRVEVLTDLILNRIGSCRGSCGTLTMPVAGSITGTGNPGVSGVAGVRIDAVMSAGFTGTPLSRSLVKALPTFGSPVAPLTGPKLSSVATMAGGTSRTVTTVA